MKVLRYRYWLMMCVALMLSIMPKPIMFELIRPAWVLLLIIYAQCFHPKLIRPPYIIGWGLCLDVLQPCLMGAHVIALLVVSLLLKNKSRRFQFFMILQQMGVVALLSGLYELTLVMSDLLLGSSKGLILGVFGSCLMNALIWPWVCFILDKICVSYANR
jgi:rod shape-determining protein MreD